MATLMFVALAYLLGSVPFAILMSKAFGLADPRTYGSGNPGATNVLRSGKKMAAALTLLGDAAKGWVAVSLVMHYLPGDAWAAACAGLAVFLGHLFPVFLRFKGGKGVATALGVLLALSVWQALIALAVWVLAAFAFRYSSLAALLAALSAPIYAVLRMPSAYAWASLALAALLIWRHQGNIRRLLAGTETRIGRAKQA